MTATSMKTFTMSTTSDTHVRTHLDARKNDNYGRERLTKIGAAIAVLVSLVALASEVYATDDETTTNRSAMRGTPSPTSDFDSMLRNMASFLREKKIEISSS